MITHRQVTAARHLYENIKLVLEKRSNKPPGHPLHLTRIKYDQAVRLRAKARVRWQRMLREYKRQAKDQPPSDALRSWNVRRKPTLEQYDQMRY